MKKLFITMTTLFCMLLLVSCGNDGNADMPVFVEVECALEPAAPSYSSLEEFIEAVKTTDESDYAFSRAKFEKLDELIVPASMPEVYKLYFIQADRDYIALWYLPEDCLSDIAVSEMRNQHFYFQYHRSGNLNKFIKESGGKKSDMIDDRYFIKNTDYERSIYWEENGSLLSLSLPGNMFIEDGNVISTFNSVETVVASLEEICSVEFIPIVRGK